MKKFQLILLWIVIIFIVIMTIGMFSGDFFRKRENQRKHLMLERENCELK